MAFCSSLGGENNIYIILTPVWIDSVMIYCWKIIKIRKKRAQEVITRVVTRRHPYSLGGVFLKPRPGESGVCLYIGPNRNKASRFTPFFYFVYWKRTACWLKKYIGLLTFPHFKCAERPECMGHNTCKSMGGVLCVVRRHIQSGDNILSL